jgi:hypothetical protein
MMLLLLLLLFVPRYSKKAAESLHEKCAMTVRVDRLAVVRTTIDSLGIWNSILFKNSKIWGGDLLLKGGGGGM